LDRNICRRLKRLEAHVASETDPFSFRIPFLDSMKRVTSTLLLAPGKQVWTNLEDVAYWITRSMPSKTRTSKCGSLRWSRQRYRNHDQTKRSATVGNTRRRDETDRQ